MRDVNNPPAQESIEDKLDKLKARRQALVLQFLDMNKDFAIPSTQHIAAIKSKYGDDIKSYKAFHILGSSSINADQPYFDFPEPEYSIEKFIEKMEKKYAEKKA